MSQPLIQLSLTRISLHVDHIKAQVCPNCPTIMELHQPDSEYPERMLWTCHHCGTWFLMDIDSDRSEAVLVCLPDHGYFRALFMAGAEASPGDLIEKDDPS